MRLPPVDELVGLLNKNAPNALEQLRLRYPAEERLMHVGIVAGDVAADMNVRIDIALAGLNTARDVCRSCILTVRNKLRFADKTQFAGQITTIVAGASIFGVLATTVPDFARYSAAVLALVGSVLTFISQHTLKGFGGKDSNIYDSYSALVDCLIEADSLLRELEIRKQTGEADKTTELVGQANALSGKITRLNSLVGV
jgi:hypothetical protein